jgi:hypothetical protein
MAVETVMETFTLIAWLMMGQRFEEMRLPHLYPIQCTVFRDEMLRERSPVRAECVPEPAPRAIMPLPHEYRPDDRCILCGFQRGIRRV